MVASIIMRSYSKPGQWHLCIIPLQRTQAAGDCWWCSQLRHMLKRSEQHKHCSLQ
jgi:hypothetical protein